MGTAMVNLKAESLNTWMDDAMVIQFAKAYPNPFSDEIILEFCLARAADITIQIRNVLGSLVANQTLDAMEAGVNQWIWDGKTGTGSEVSQGLYFLHMHCGDSMNNHVIRIVRQQ
jgi:hypothetical protein